MSALHCYADIRHLHSFPTRRSSDLVRLQAPELVVPRVVDVRQGDRRLGKAGGTVQGAEQVPLGALDGPSDRKSTRLNSSHSQSSYAVFCLKKKILIQVDERSFWQET